MSGTRQLMIGAFVVGGLVLFTVVTAMLNEWDFLSQRHIYYGMFKNARELNVGAPILVYGYPSGTVASIRLVPGEYPLMVEMKIDKNIELHADAKVHIISASLIGDTTINIDAGTEEFDVLPPGSHIVGTSGNELEEVAAEVADELISTLRGINNYLYDRQTQDDFKRIVGNLATATEKMDQTLSIVNEEFRPMVEAMMDSATKWNALVTDARSLVQRADEQVSVISSQVEGTAAAWESAAGSFSTELEETSAAIQELSASLNQTAGRLDEQIEMNAGRIEQTLEELKTVARSIREMVDQVQSGQGTLGKLITDSGPFDRLNQLLTALSNTLTGSRAPMFNLGEGGSAGTAPGRPTAP
ncbi:MAG: mce related protein [candidate division BRC1 bacterium ADurb.BinA292]|nr:MAG: mce related protein [candidate division BRC1 bacterium ADurb.BinA292]